MEDREHLEVVVLRKVENRVGEATGHPTADVAAHLRSFSELVERLGADADKEHPPRRRIFSRATSQGIDASGWAQRLFLGIFGDAGPEILRRPRPPSRRPHPVLTVPWPRRLLLARSPELVKGVLRVALHEIQRWLRRRAGQPSGQGGSDTVTQRFGSALNLNLHFHILALDGLYCEDPNDGTGEGVAPATLGVMASFARSARGPPADGTQTLEA